MITWTTLMTKHREMGRVARMINKEMKVMKWAHKPGPSSQLAEKSSCVIDGQVMIFLLITFII